ncbi:MAG: sulfatase [Bacteroidaceae bacterium]
MNINYFSLALAPLAITTVQAQDTTSKEQCNKRPNIILFMVDDMGWQDTSLPFWTQKTHYNEVYETPNMERLARQGMMFTQAYASSISSPSRCSLITGTNAARHRVTNWTLQRDQMTDSKSNTLQLPDWNYNGVQQTEGINNSFVGTSFVQLLKNAGYHTIHCGKAHFGAMNTPGENPTHWGFETNIAGHAAGGLASYLGEQNYGNRTDGKPQSPFAIPGLEKYWGTETFATEALTQEALKALDKAKKYKQPFYLYMAHYAIHIPIEKDLRFYQKYINKGMTPKEAAYATLIEGMDKSLGDLMNWVEKNGEADNTILLFMSDNGGFATDSYWRSGQLYTQNAPLNSGKGSAYEGGIREPMIVSWPGKVQPNTRCNKYLLIEDFYPTILEMAGIKKYKTVQPIDGMSFMPLLTQTGDPSKGRSLYWNCPNIWGNVGPGIGPTCSVRQGDWKLVYYYESQKKELFQITEDIGEKNNQAASHPDLVRKLSRNLGAYLRKVGGQRPSYKATKKPCPWPDETK